MIRTPYNFDGNVESVPPELIQLTMAAMLAGLLQASSKKWPPGLVALDPMRDEQILKRHQEERDGKEDPQVANADSWKSDLRQLVQSAPELDARAPVSLPSFGKKRQRAAAPGVLKAPSSYEPQSLGGNTEGFISTDDIEAFVEKRLPNLLDDKKLDRELLTKLKRNQTREFFPR